MRTRIISISVLSFFLMMTSVIFLFLKPSFGNNTVATCDEKNMNCRQSHLPYQNSALSPDERIADLLGRMTLAEKIGQMALIEKKSIDDERDIANYGLGALLSGGGGKPDHNTPYGWLQMVNHFQRYSQHTRLAIPLLYGVDANHGHGNVPGATLFPHFIGLGATHNPSLVREIGRATAEEVAATGISWIFSPTLDVTQDTRWGRTYETFGSDPALVSALGTAFIEGVQSFEMSGLRMIATAKHYVGNGSMQWGTSVNKEYALDQGNVIVSETELRAIHLEPFRYAVHAGVKTVMVGLNTWHGEKVAANAYLLNDVLKGELGFHGIVLSDWYGVYEGEKSKYAALVRSVNAGIDMVMLPFDYKNFSRFMHRAVENGDISMERIDDAVRRILRVKFEAGLFDHPPVDSLHIGNVGAQAHKEVARRAVRESLVLLKDTGIFPLAKETPRIFVTGSAAHNMGKQSGGWTVEWQGVDGNQIPGTTILDGIRNSVSLETVVVYDERGYFVGETHKADIGIAVVGEYPYAEGKGDEEHPRLSEEDRTAIRSVRAKSEKTIVVIVSGRPLDIREGVKEWDAVVAAWLPGSEGEGVADVLFGDYPFTGTLPVQWDF